MTPYELQKILQEKGITYDALAKEIGVKKPMITNVIRYNAGSHPVRKVLAAKVGLKPEDIWPDKYKNGRPRKPGRYPNY